jgi:hypothetical protein
MVWYGMVWYVCMYAQVCVYAYVCICMYVSGMYAVSCESMYMQRVYLVFKVFALHLRVGIYLYNTTDVLWYL